VIPEGLATFVAFLVLVAPGLTQQLVLERRHPRREESAFREASRIALSSLGFSALAAFVLLVLRELLPDALPDTSEWRRDGWGYLEDHPFLVALALGFFLLISCGGAGALGWWMTRTSHATLSDHGIWFQVLRRERPDATRAWVHLRLKNDHEFWGHLRHYTEEAAEVRDIAIGGPDLIWRPGKGEEAEVIGDSWDAVVVAGDQLAFVRVVYQEAAVLPGRTAGRLRRRRTHEEPNGELIS
jgi:hypothetical protein